MTPRRAVLLALAPILPGCLEDEPSIRLDVNKNCNEAEVRLVLSDADTGAIELLDAAMDPGSDTVWLLVVVEGDGRDGGRIEVHRMEHGVVQEIVPIPPPQRPGTLSLRASPDAEQVWVMHRGEETFRLWRVDPLLGENALQSSLQLVTFPHDTFSCGLSCDTGPWYRDLVFLDERPFAVSVPPVSPTAAVSVWVGALLAAPPDTGSIEIGTEHRLDFEKMCSPSGDPFQDEACEASKATISYPTITVLGRQVDPRPSTARLLVYRERAEEEVPGTFPDVFVVSVGIDSDGIPQGILRSYQDPFQATTGPPQGLAVDDFASYALYTTQFGGTRLLRLPSPPGELDFEDLSLDVGLLDEATRLLQLDADIATGRIEDGAWEITKIFPDSLSRSVTTRYETDAAITDVHGIGAGTFLLEKEGRGPEVVRVRCVDPGD